MSAGLISQTVCKGKTLAVRIVEATKSSLKRRWERVVSWPDRHRLAFRWFSFFSFIVAIVTFFAVVWAIFGIAQDREPYDWHIGTDKPDTMRVFNASLQPIGGRVVDGRFSQVKPVFYNEQRKLIAAIDFTEDGRGEDAGRLIMCSQRGLPGFCTRVVWQPLYGPVKYEGKQLGVTDFAVADFDGDGASEIILVGAPKLRAFMPSLLVVIDETGEELARCEQPVGRFEKIEVLWLNVGGETRNLIAVSGWQMAHTFERVVGGNPGSIGGGGPVGGPEVYGVLYLFTVNMDGENLEVVKKWSMKIEPIGYGVFAVEADDIDPKDGENESLTFWHGAGLKYGICFKGRLGLLDIKFIEGRIFEPLFVSRDSVCFELFSTEACFLNAKQDWCDESEP